MKIIFFYNAVPIPATMSHFTFTGCLKYNAAPPEEIIDSIQKDSKLVIGHLSNQIVERKDISISGDTIKRTPAPISEVSWRYSAPAQKRSNYYKKNHYGEVLSQVHTYINETLPETYLWLFIPGTSVTRYDILTLDIKVTRNSKIPGSIVVTAVGIGLILFIFPGLTTLPGILFFLKLIFLPVLFVRLNTIT